MSDGPLLRRRILVAESDVARLQTRITELSSSRSRLNTMRLWFAKLALAEAEHRARKAKGRLMAMVI